MSSVYNPVADLADEEQVYQICLLTSYPAQLPNNDYSMVITSYAALNQIGDVNYQPQETTMDEVDQTPDAISVKLLPVVFSGENFSQAYTVVAVAIIIEDDVFGNVVHHVDVLDSPFTIGPSLPDVIIYPEAAYMDFTYVSNIDWTVSS